MSRRSRKGLDYLEKSNSTVKNSFIRRIISDQALSMLSQVFNTYA